MAYKRKRYVRRNFRRKGKKLPPVGRAAVRKRRVAQVRQVVRREMTRTQEVKSQFQSETLFPSSLQSGTTSMVGNYYVLNPSTSTFGYSIARGTANNQMVGNSVITKRCTLYLTIAPTPYNAGTNPFMVPMLLRCYIYKNRNRPVADPDPADYGSTGNFFDNGTNYVGFTGTINDMNRRVNTDKYQYLGHRTFKLGPAIPQSGATSTTPSYTMSNNDFKLSYYKQWDVTRYLPKKCVFDDSGVWNNARVFLLWQVVPALPTTPYAVNTTLPVQITMQARYDYYDA